MNAPIKVLVVDDDEEILFATTRVLRAEGFLVQEATTASQAETLVREQRPDLVLLDVVLPDRSGTELCREIKADPQLQDTFVVLTSGVRTGSTEVAQGLDDGADGYLGRPIANQELRARVRSMARIIRAERERDRLIDELQQALAKVQLLRGLLPVCSYCKRIRDDQGEWNEIEIYVQAHSEADFSHGVCPECLEKHFPEEETDPGSHRP